MSVLPPGTVTTASKGGIVVATNLHVVSLSVAAYDYLLTLPYEFQLYRSSDRKRLGLILFILIRYSSMLVLIFSNVGFFDTHFSRKSCGQYYLLAPIFKIIQVMVSQAILGFRTYYIARRNVWVRWFILSLYFTIVGFQSFACLANRTTVTIDGNCIVASPHPESPFSTWSFHLAATLFDLLTLSISTVYLLNLKTSETSHTSRLVKRFLYYGLGNFLALTAANVVNMIMFRNPDRSIQSSGASLNYAVTWILSQRLLIYLHASIEQASVVVTPIRMMRVAPSEVHFSGGTTMDSTDNPTSSLEHAGDRCLQVHVERTLIIDLKPEGKEPVEIETETPDAV
ncbi:hypothetical protein BGW80DRAFT_475874 [Lactifluus volemus]|nr:hypothetical protein BGW80DRAFT_475874 [Lactifluus volemus]